MFLGNKWAIKYFNDLIKNETLSHAYVFYGPQGVGKKSLALNISQKLLGALNSSPDIKIIDKGGEQIYISDIRDLKNFLYLTSFGKYKVAIINNAHNLNPEASNALLKVLEEPPGRSLTFLVTHLERALLPTIISRCQLIRFRPLGETEIFDYLVDEHKIKKEEALKAAKLARGSLGLAIDLASNFEEFKKNVSLLNELLKSGFARRFETAKEISAAPDSLKKVVKNWFIYAASLEGGEKLAKELLYLNNIISRPQFNHRLVFENFLAGL